MPLFIVSTPIGNLKDITNRALEVLAASSVILSENTKTTNLLLTHYNILHKKIINYTDHTTEKDFLPFLELAKTFTVCLVSEAGTPIISDPGYELVKKAHELKVQVKAVPGASSLVAAIANSGLPAFNFAFLGFYTKSNLTKLESCLENEITACFFVPARDIVKTLTELKDVAEFRDISVSRELTKVFEETKTGTFAEVFAYYAESERQKGEAVIVISGKQITQSKPPLQEIITQILIERPFLQNLSIKNLAECLAFYEESLISFSKKQIYNELLILNKM